jgi:hypothetical protein
MEHSVRDRLKDYRSSYEHSYIQFYSNNKMRPLSSYSEISVWIRQDWQELRITVISVLYFIEGEEYSPKK